MLSGPSQSGKTHTLCELAGLLNANGIAHSLIGYGADDALVRIEQASPPQILLFDGLELASAELLRSLAQKLAAGMTCIGTLSTDSEAATYHEVLLELIAEQHPAATKLSQTRNFRIASLTDIEAERMAETLQNAPLDSVTIAAATSLSWGRPGWLVDLLQLAEAGKVTADPHPTITGIDIGDLHLAAFHFVSQAAEKLLTPSSIAAAITLSQLEPRTPSGASELVGSHAVSMLREAGLLVSSPDNADLVGVPEIYAAPLRLKVDPTLLQQTEHLAAQKLLTQESFGIRLPDRESSFCAWAFTPFAAFPGPDSAGSVADAVATIAAAPADTRHTAVGGSQGAHDAALSRAHAELIGRVTSELVLFGRPEARDLLLRMHAPEALDEFTRVHAATTFRGPIEGLRALQTMAERNNATHSAEATGNEATAARELRIEFLRHHFHAQTDDHARNEPGKNQRGRPYSGALNTDTLDLDHATLVFARWNDTAPLGDDVREILATAQTHPVPEVALMAEQLLVLEGARSGSQLSENLLSNASLPLPATAKRARAHSGVANAQRRHDRISNLALTREQPLHELLFTSIVAEAIIALLSATNLSGSSTFQRTVQRLPATSFHELWVHHLGAAMNALAGGSITRADREWRAMQHRLPTFLPLRLQAIITAIGAELRGESTTPTAERLPSQQLFDYFRGALDVVQIAPAPPKSPLDQACGATQAPVFRLAAAHLEALEAQNPASLLRTAESLVELNLWAPAVYALQGARAIFMRRRASGSVSRCDARLREVELSARQYAPWFSARALSSTPRSRLTKREIDVARLGSGGLSNRQIAEQLICSVRTVESHLAAARAKLGATNRSELALRMQDLGYL